MMIYQNVMLVMRHAAIMHDPETQIDDQDLWRLTVRVTAPTGFLHTLVVVFCTQTTNTLAVTTPVNGWQQLVSE